MGIGWKPKPGVYENMILVVKNGNNHLSSDQNPGYLLYEGDYTTQLYRDYNKP